MDIVSYMMGKNSYEKSYKIPVDSGAYLFYNDARLNILDKCDFSSITGTSFVHMFKNCTSLTTIPNINTSNGTVFEGMFLGCENITTIPIIDTSNGASFFQFAMECKKLVSFPELDFSNGKNFHQAFQSCLSLTTIPDLDLSNATKIAYIFQACIGLVHVGKLHTPNLKNCYKMAWGSSALKTIESINVSNVSEQTIELISNKVFEHIRFEGVIPITITFASTPKLTIDSAKDILTKLVDYSGTDKAYYYSVLFNSVTWDLLNVEGETSPDGTTWETYVDSKGWNM